MRKQMKVWCVVLLFSSIHLFGQSVCLVIKPDTLPEATVNVYYQVQFSAIGGVSPYTFWADTLPPGLQLTSNGLLYGVVPYEGVYSFMVFGNDSTGYCQGARVYDLVVRRECPLISIYPTQLVDANIGVYYNQQLTAEGGSPPYNFSIANGKLPKGLSLSRDGIIDGVPEESGQFNFLVMVYDSNNCSGGMSYTLNVNCISNYGRLSGVIGFLSDYGDRIILLNGESVTGFLTIVGENGAIYTANIQNGLFDFGEVYAQNYNIDGEISYIDNILFDAKLLSYGCEAPSNFRVIKTVKLQKKIVNVKCDTNNFYEYIIPPPLVFIHSSYDCYKKWFYAESMETDSSYFDNYSRNNGFITFTPNYSWWNNSFLNMAKEVLEELDLDFKGITSSRIPPFYVIAHGSGCFLLRVIGNSLISDEMITKKIKKAYLLGPPNSGYMADIRISNEFKSGETFITNILNDVFPSYGTVSPYIIAGNKGLLGSRENDGYVSLDSVFNLKKVACFEDDCVSYPSIKYPFGVENIISYDHMELGSPPSVPTIFSMITKDSEIVDPEAPVGAITWGTTYVTSQKIESSSTQLKSETTVDYPFDISKSDGFAIYLKILSGTGKFKIVDPEGNEYQIEKELFYQRAPKAGKYFLRVSPEGEDLRFEAHILEDSLFGIKAYFSQRELYPMEIAHLRVDKSGDWSLVQTSQAKAKIFDSEGNLVKEIALNEYGNYFSGSFEAPSTVGYYLVLIEINGLYDGFSFVRSEFEMLNVIPILNCFDPNFVDYGVDLNGDGKLDALGLNFSVNILEEGYYVVSGDLYDFNFNFVTHGYCAFNLSAPQKYESTIYFDLSSIKCEQIKRFYIKNLKLIDGENLAILDKVTTPIISNLYDSTYFTCDPSPLKPEVNYVIPSKMIRGTSGNVVIVGKNFKENVILEFDDPIEVESFRRFNERVIFASLFIKSSVQTGFYGLTVRNPDGRSGRLEKAILVGEDEPPNIYLSSPLAGEKVGGIAKVIVRASDDIRVDSVELEIDGISKGIINKFPFIFEWDTSKENVGYHSLKVKAKDSKGQITSLETSVEVIRFPVVKSMTKKGDPFRIIVNGENFLQGIEVYINGEKWTNISFKNSNKVVIKGGTSLKSKVPKGVKTTFKFVNPDGGETTYIWQR